jgi:GT2 family glycosyltransferase
VKYIDKNIAMCRYNTDKFLVTIILLTWNGEKYIPECAKSIAEQTHKNIEVIVVDNGSVDNSFQDLKCAHPEWIYIQHTGNIGFSAGMNSGLELARGKYVIPLNQDVYLDNSFIEKSVTIMETLANAGALGGVEYLWEGNKLTDKLKSPGPALFLRLRIKGMASIIETSIAKSFGVNGSFPFLRREALIELKKLDGHIYDTDYFSGWEDVDLYCRIQLRGWECYATQNIKAWHVGSSFDEERESFFAKSTFYQGWVMRNRWFVILKNLPIFVLIFLSPLLILIEIILPFYLLCRSPRTLRAWLNSWREILVSLSSICAKRRIIQNSRKISSFQIMRWFKGI